MRSFRPLLKAIGVRDSFSAVDYAEVLDIMQKEHGGRSLPDKRAELAMEIARHLYDHASSLGNPPYLPSEANVLMLATTMYYNDAPWLRDGNDQSQQQQQQQQKQRVVVNPKLSHAVAARLGVKSLRSELLSTNASGLNEHLGLKMSSEAFGQRENLTQRLKNILLLYAEGPGTLFEFVQNADDAGASKVVFLLDLKTHGQKALIASKMRHAQGPALCVYNDSMFTPRDLIAISRIGQGSKLTNMGKTGRFGLGFNSCYHFTDIPSFVSGTSLVIFDPHLDYLPGANASDPGLLVKFGENRPDIRRAFPHQFEPYLLFGCDLKSDFKGTLFRFPLRSSEMAAKSNIKSIECTPASILDLFRTFEEPARMCLLFLRHVVRLEVKVRLETGQIVDLFDVCLEDATQRKRGVWHRVARQIGVGGVSKREFFQKMGVMEAKKLPGGAQELNVKTTIYNSEYPNPEGESHDEKDGKETGKAAAATEKSKGTAVTLDVDSIDDNMKQQQRPWKTIQEKFLMYEMIGGGSARDMAVEKAAKGHKLLPWAGVAARLTRTESVFDDPKKKKKTPATATTVTTRSEEGNTTMIGGNGSAFCFLPLPVRTGLSVHVNGYFELSANRRNIWWGSDMTGDGEMRSRWNRLLIKDVVSDAYAKLILEASKRYKYTDECYFQLWPHSEAKGEPWRLALRETYQKLVELPVLYTTEEEGEEANDAGSSSGQWCIPGETVYVPHYYPHIKKEKKKGNVKEEQGGGGRGGGGEEKNEKAVGRSSNIVGKKSPSLSLSTSSQQLREDGNNKHKRKDNDDDTDEVIKEKKAKIAERLFFVLKKCGVPVVALPSDGIRYFLERTEKGPKKASANFLRWFLSTFNSPPNRCTRDDALFLLDYCLSDFTDYEQQQQNKEKDGGGGGGGGGAASANNFHLKDNISTNNKVVVASSSSMPSGRFQDLIGLPLLPVADGSFVAFKANARGTRHAPRNVYIASDSVRSIFCPKLAKSFLHPGLSPRLRGLFGLEGFQRSTNITKLGDPHAADLLKLLLPPEWQGGRKTLSWATVLAAAKRREEEDDEKEEKEGEMKDNKRKQRKKKKKKIGGKEVERNFVGSPIWLKQLWRFLLRDVKDLSVFSGAKTGLPIVPTLNGKLCQLDRKELAIISTVGFPKPVETLLVRKLNCLCLDHAKMGLTASELSGSVVGPTHALWQYIYKPTLQDLLIVFSRILKPNPAACLLRGRGGGGGGGGGGKSIVERHEAVALRHFIIESAFKEGRFVLKKEEIEFVKSLPIFEVYEGHRFSSRSPSSSSQSSTSSVMLQALTGRIRPPNGVNERLLDSRFVKVAKQEERLLECLGVKQMDELELYKTCLFERKSSMPMLPQHVVEEAVVEVLHQLPRLNKQTNGWNDVSDDNNDDDDDDDSDGDGDANNNALLQRFREYIRGQRFISPDVEKDDGKHSKTKKKTARQTPAAAAAAAAAAAVYHRPDELYDPKQPTLVALLPRRCFPSAMFSSTDILLTLRGLGLKSKIDRAGVLSAVRHISALPNIGSSDEEKVTLAMAMKEKKALARRLLLVLDKTSGEDLFSSLLDDDDKKPGEGPGNNTKKVAGEGKGGIISELDGCNSDAAELDSDDDDKVLDILKKKEREVAIRWIEELRQTAWLPVMAQPPIHGLPWYHAQQQQQQQQVTVMIVYVEE
eukprot:jgi/Bigna1/134999/aug1.27_g9707